MSYFSKIGQDVQADVNNTSADNLRAANAYTYTGTGSSTLGVAGLQWNLKTDQNATVYIEQSNDNSNWDISQSFDYYHALGGRGETVQATSAYWRIRVILTGTTDTSYFRLEGILCPIIEALPSRLSNNGNLQTVTSLRGDENTDRHVWVSPSATLSINDITRLVGTNFDGIVKDTNFWTETLTGAGSVVQSGEIKLQTNTTANGSAKYESVRAARFIVGCALRFTGAFKFNDTVTEADNVRRCGAYDALDGFFFELDAGIFSVGTRSLDGTTTLVSSGSFKGTLGDTFILDPTKYYKLDIEWTPLGSFYYINDKLLHQSVGGHLTERLTLPITMENINDNNNATAVVFDCLGVVINRLGPLLTNPTSKWISTNTTTVCKYGAGILHRVIVSDNLGEVTIYDNTAGSGKVLSILDTSQGANPMGSVEFGAPFNDGLTIVNTGGITLTIIYE